LVGVSIEGAVGSRDLLFGGTVVCLVGIGRDPIDGIRREVAELFIGV